MNYFQYDFLGGQHKTSGLKASSDWLSDKPCQAALWTSLPRKVLIKEECNHASSFAKMIFILMFLNHFPRLKHDLRNLPNLPSEGWPADRCEAPMLGLRSKLWTKQMLSPRSRLKGKGRMWSEKRNQGQTWTDGEPRQGGRQTQAREVDGDACYCTLLVTCATSSQGKQEGRPYFLEF